MTKTILITGASSGLGKAAAKQFASSGWNVIATMRSPEKEKELITYNNILVIKLDVQQKESITQAISEGLDRFGRIDVLVNNAGYGILGAFELSTSEQVQDQFDVNVFGLMDVTRAILPHFRKQAAGMIINISSMGGRVTFPLTSLYIATKFAVEGFSESLAYELAPFNIRVKLIEPGAVATNWYTSIRMTANPDITDYNSFVQAAFAKWDELNPSPAGEESVAKVIYEAATDESIRMRYLATDDARLLVGQRENLADEEYLAWMRQRYIPFVNAK